MIRSQKYYFAAYWYYGIFGRFEPHKYVCSVNVFKLKCDRNEWIDADPVRGGVRRRSALDASTGKAFIINDLQTAPRCPKYQKLLDTFSTTSKIYRDASLTTVVAAWKEMRNMRENSL